VWYVPVSGRDIAFVRALRPLLADWEQERLDSFRYVVDKVSFVAAHALVRVALSRQHPVPLTEWQFDRTEGGRPFVREPREAEGIQFSLSHTPRLVGCAVAFRAVGFDLAALDQELELGPLLLDIMESEEIAQFIDCPAGDRTKRFLSLWTLKEALAKGLGVGMAVPFSSLAFRFGSDNEVSLEALPLSLGEASRWKMRLFGFMRTHVGAVAAISEPGEAIEFRTSQLDMGALLRALQPDL
jgi:4'-phosphopantetheinyl transferase